MKIHFIIWCGTLVFFLLLANSNIQIVHGDGFAEETLPPFNINGEKLFLYTKVSPSVIKHEDGQNRYLEVKIIDYNTEESVPNATYQILLFKDNKIIMEGKFHSEPGPLNIRIEPKGNHLVVSGFTSLSNGTWNTSTGDITIQGPILLDPGLYHLSISILRLGNIKDEMLVPPRGLIFDSWLSVADVKNNIVENEGATYNVTIISYYDRISSFSFAPETKTISWAIPFDWNLSRVDHQNILVHEEVKVPRSLFNGSPLNYRAYVNGMPISGRSLIIDPFSSSNNAVVHLLINKQDITNFLKNKIINTNDKTMLFNLKFLQFAQLESSSELQTENGQVSISLIKVPEQLVANSKSILLLRFNDPATGIPINADVTYGVKILDPTGKSIINQTSKTVIYNTTDRIEVMFPTKGIYQIVISIEGLAPLDSDELDITRNGIARGYLLVE